ncbi:flagellar export chaperone FliS [Endozoicomonas sp. SM1973]|uniref:Flagellar secretion chaperone FliS n=1 Tax=Spartinivicinus marinus TaxID=2994442 RepID=A0A853I6N3_9GAMM|nr:flagellar export chaperone FliS [Spartinivicinus marinus]MCX4029882.1 flagellar export chaperone FliS [Spartinivicinus marinus]NYZ64875.1 flagellar export chaperone FliS [Spartinivicinus marinus]
MNAYNQLKQYQAVNRETGIIDADPHKLIQLLIDGALERLLIAKGHIERKEIEEKNRFINKAIEIIGGLRSFLDKEQGGDVAESLFSLYEYMEFRLFEANASNSPELVEEVIKLLREVKTGWDGIREQVAQPTAVG